MFRQALTRFKNADLGRIADGLVAAVAASLPWSTTATGVLIVAWLIVALPKLFWPSLKHQLFTAPGGFIVLLWLFAAVGMSWADVSMSERLQGLGAFNKLMAIPVLFEQFRRSERIHWVTLSFLASSIVLVLVSWTPVFYPPWEQLLWRKWQGVPVKNYISQSAIFQLCIFGLAYAAVEAWRKTNKRLALLLAALAVLFAANVTYVIVSFTAALLTPILALLLAFRLARWRGLAVAVLVIAVLGPIGWTWANSVRTRLHSIVELTKANAPGEYISSVQFRLEFYQKAAAIIADAPFIGHGTGTIREYFEKSSAGKSGIAGVVTGNPHEQTFAVAIQLGLIGVLILWAMWISHLYLFRAPGMIEWFGLLVVTQDILGCLINTHLFDFTEGWTYVIGVGALGGAALRRSAAARAGETAELGGEIA